MNNKILWRTLKEIADGDEYPFTMGQIRDFIMKKHTNDFSKCLRKIGRRIYVRLDLFDDWIEKHEVKDENRDESI